ncbi:hypothetical protein J2Z62_000199 [Mycoplasmoides fastidiosum]|uniref:Lycopene cyclase domain-containing protein n=1 Tax=Mycoplasmoides fastidiosum TaxID=92758 RepID=A0ABU0LYH6_9BACT|nr:DUF5378 family protein [Mycoplasmoides fastidiosum]MDQ0513761.1 hypothetical protein [Mycoplasmoides fastidiosum]UUD37818.1 DUF5378 domain-containing protein [Mycoplasmoides fastidiosum]
MTAESNLLLIASLIIVACVGIIFYFRFHNFALKPKVKYWLFAFWGGIAVIYFVAARWGLDFSNWLNLSNAAPDYQYSIAYSKVFLLDMCPFLSVFMGLNLIFDKKRKITRQLATISIFTGGITLYALKITSMGPVNAEFIFLGFYPNRLYFLMHYNIVFMGAIILAAYPKKFDTKALFSTVFMGGIYLLYVYLFIRFGNVQWNVTGLSVNDWSNFAGIPGEYYAAGQILGLDFPNNIGATIGVYIGVTWLISFIHNGVNLGFHHWKFLQLKKKMQSHKPWINRTN